MISAEHPSLIDSSQNQKILFLDIDGVLISEEYFKKKFSKQTGLSRFNPDSVSLIKALIEEFSLRIVISSSWRYAAIDKLMHELKINKLFDYLYYDWFTPVIHPAHRGMEIRLWLDLHTEVNEYVILDDDENILDEQKDNYVQTQLDYGMITKHYNRVRAILSIVMEAQE
jgi:hypothetical protein